MSEKQIEIQLDVCWNGEDIPHGLAGACIYFPAYRIFVDSDLLTERTYVHHGHKSYIEELIVVKLLPGKHLLRVEKLNDARDMLKVDNMRINEKSSDFEFFV